MQVVLANINVIHENDRATYGKYRITTIAGMTNNSIMKNKLTAHIPLIIKRV